eukprot:CAMPEP_0116142334 /NCGR_PEP_ID=MMETSP0329-20121206/14855_1 /TAXON_ID=697910 /ORGANISM="Pseudo-nitzschia arenysensis, Strain B593" /LENGTH=444 /DNA_ID=CAMNT_0003637567 /DNA_START=104 /DNA_END=1438 /DNA_ORIENTATION=-
MNMNRQMYIESAGVETKHLRERRKPTPNAFEDVGLSVNTTEPIQPINTTDTSFNFTNTTLLGDGTNSDSNTYSESDMLWTVLCPIFLIAFCVFGQRSNVPSSQYHRGAMIRRQAERVWAIQRVKDERQAIPTETRKEQIEEGLRIMKVVSKDPKTGHCILGEVESEEQNETEDADDEEPSSAAEEDTKPSNDESLDTTEDVTPATPPTLTASAVAAATSSGSKNSNISCPESPGRTERKPLLSADSEDSEDNFGSTTETTPEVSQPPVNNYPCYDFEDDEDVCPICLDNFEVGDTVMFSRHHESMCAHVFHEECLLQWLLQQRENECPTCRACFIADHETNSIVSSSPSTADTNENSILESDEETMSSETSGDIEEGNSSGDSTDNTPSDENNSEMQNVKEDHDNVIDDLEEQDFTYIIVKGSVQRLPLSQDTGASKKSSKPMP